MLWEWASQFSFYSYFFLSNYNYSYCQKLISQVNIAPFFEYSSWSMCFMLVHRWSIFQNFLQIKTFVFRHYHYINEGASNGDVRPKSATTLLSRYYTIQNEWLSTLMIFIHVAQGAAKPPEFKIGGQKDLKFLIDSVSYYACTNMLIHFSCLFSIHSFGLKQFVHRTSFYKP